MGNRARVYLLALACFALFASAMIGDASGGVPSGARQTAEPQAASAAPTAAPQTVATVVVETAPPKPVRRPKPVPVVRDLRLASFASVLGVKLFHPAKFVERIGFHQASDKRDRDLAVRKTAKAPKVLPARGRGTSARSAADIVVEPREGIYAPVSGIVKRARSYRLYCKYPDNFAVISPDGHPELEVKILHMHGLRVHAGQRVVAGKTKLAWHATKFPFRSQVERFTKHKWPHVHIEVTKLAIPSAKPRLGKGLQYGC